MITRYSTIKDHRRARVRAKLKGTPERPRLTVFRSDKHVYAQIIDDVNHKTLVSASDAGASKKKMTKSEKATLVGAAVAKAALAKKIKQVCFDRGHYRFLGRVKTLAQAAREAGLEF